MVIETDFALQAWDFPLPSLMSEIIEIMFQLAHKSRGCLRSDDWTVSTGEIGPEIVSVEVYYCHKVL